MVRLSLCIALLSFAAGFSASCSSSPCVSECYELCDVYCDAYGCWRECYLDCYCIEVVDCFSNRDCDRGQVCIDGDCATTVRSGRALCETCSSQTSCIEAGALCVTLPGNGERVCGRRCGKDSDCPQGFSCAQAGGGKQCIPDSGSCGPVPAGCTADSQCGAGARCERGDCMDVPEAEPCEGGGCQSMACDQDTPCELGFTCLDSECRTQCTANAQCPAERICSAGLCVAPDRVQCRLSEACDEGFECVDATCKRACDADRPCPESQVCRDSWCDVDGETACADDEGCEQGEHCLDGSCQSPAQRDAGAP